MRGKNWVRAIFVMACAAGFAFGQVTIRVSVSSAGVEGQRESGSPSLSAYGQFIAFTSWASNLVPGDTNGVPDVFVHDRETGRTERVSVNSGGVEGDDSSGDPSISADGRYVAFASKARNLAPEGWGPAVFVRDRLMGTTRCVSVDLFGRARDGAAPSISSDGRYVAFESESWLLVVGDTNYVSDVFVRDLFLNVTVRASVSSIGIQGNGRSMSPWISADGRIVVFGSHASNLVAGDTNNDEDVFTHDLASRETRRASVDSYGREGNRSSFQPSISGDNRFVAFASSSTNLVLADPLPDFDVYLHDRQTGETDIVSWSPIYGKGNADSYLPRISADGNNVAFMSNATNLVVGDTNGLPDIFVRPRWQSYPVDLVSVSSSGRQGNGMSSGFPSISYYGDFVAFGSLASNLIQWDTNGWNDVFFRDRIRSAQGTVNGRFGIVDVLFANRESRALSIPTGLPVTIRLNPPPQGPVNAVYVLWVWMGLPVRQTGVTILGQHGIGWAINPTPFSPTLSPQPVWWIVGQGLPVFFENLVFPIPVTFTLQGIMEDAGSASLSGVSLTNAVIVEVGT